MKEHLKRGTSLAPGMEIGYVVSDASRWEVDLERTSEDFDVEFYSKLLEKAWAEVTFVFPSLPVCHNSYVS